MTVLLILGLGAVLGAVAWGFGRAGAPWAVLAGLGLVPVAAAFDEPGFSGAMVGGVLAALSAPMWVGGYVMGRKGRKGSL